MAPSKNTFRNCSLKNTFINYSLKKYISKLVSQKYISKWLPQKIYFKTALSKIHLKSSSKQFKVINHGCCLTKNLAHNYLVCQMCMIILINVINNTNQNTYMLWI